MCTKPSVVPTTWGEHIVHIDGVVGSSPTVTTNKKDHPCGGPFSLVMPVCLRIIGAEM